MMPSEIVELGDISQLARSAVRFGSIPTQFTTEADFCHDLLCHLTYGQFLTCSHIDVAVAYLLVTGLVCILEINIQKHVHTGVRHLLTPKELTHRTAGAPKSHSLRRYAVFGKRGKNLII